MSTADKPTPPSPAPLPPYGPPISLEAAKKVMAAAEAEAGRHDWAVVIAIVDSTGHLAMLHRLDQANLGAVGIAPRKAMSAVNFRRSTKVFDDLLAGGGTGLRMLAFSPELLPVEGGLPLIQRGQVVGAIGVSGLQSSQDAQVAEAGAAALAD